MEAGSRPSEVTMSFRSVHAAPHLACALLLVLAAVLLAVLSQPAAAVPRPVQDAGVRPRSSGRWQRRPHRRLTRSATRVAAVAQPCPRLLCEEQLHEAAPTTATGRSTSSGRRTTRSTRPGPGCCTSETSTPSCKTRPRTSRPARGSGSTTAVARITKYNHLDSITATEGQLVTPTTVIGLMGHSGDVMPCTTNYLHFEVRSGGVTGVRVNPGSLLACTGQGRIRMPDALGATTWDDPRCREGRCPPP